jgi:hypothetical protein
VLLAEVDKLSIVTGLSMESFAKKQISPRINTDTDRAIARNAKIAKDRRKLTRQAGVTLSVLCEGRACCRNLERSEASLVKHCLAVNLG